jgi:hypothetical protein
VVAAALRLVWERHPTSLKAKELFETAEAFALLEAHLAELRRSAAATDDT